MSSSCRPGQSLRSRSALMAPAGQSWLLHWTASSRIPHDGITKLLSHPASIVPAPARITPTLSVYLLVGNCVCRAWPLLLHLGLPAILFHRSFSTRCQRACCSSIGRVFHLSYPSLPISGSATTIYNRMKFGSTSRNGPGGRNPKAQGRLLLLQYTRQIHSYAQSCTTYNPSFLPTRGAHLHVRRPHRGDGNFECSRPSLAPTSRFPGNRTSALFPTSLSLLRAPPEISLLISRQQGRCPTGARPAWPGLLPCRSTGSSGGPRLR